MVKVYSKISDVAVGKPPMSLRVRVIRLWIVKSNFIPGVDNSIEMVLLDERGWKIHATVRRHLINLFKGVLIEGDVYDLSIFCVVDSYGVCRPTRHPCRIFFQSSTQLERVDSQVIKQNGLSLMSVGQINSHRCDSNYLVDLMGVMSGISSQSQFIRDGRPVKMIVIELSDNGGECHVVLFGEMVEYLIQVMKSLEGGLPVVVLQFAKVRYFRGRVLLQNIHNITRIWLNPAIDDAVMFGRRLGNLRGGPRTPVPFIGPHSKPSLADDFLRLYPKKTIAELKLTLEDGPFIVAGVVEALVEGQHWWFPSCCCTKRLIPNDVSYFCRSCSKHVFHIIPRFAVKVHVCDGIDDAIFVLPDEDVAFLTGANCSSLLTSSMIFNRSNPPDRMIPPPELYKMERLKLLFKIGVVSSMNPVYHGCFKVTRVCVDPDIVHAFSVGGGRNTPSKSIFKPSTSEHGETLNQAEDVADSGFYVSKRKLGDAFQGSSVQDGDVLHKRPSFNEYL